MEAANILDVEKFVLECNDCLSGKFLDLNKRLERLLNVMAQSEDVVALLCACLQDFDEQTEFDAAFFVDKRTGGAKIVFPTDDNKKLALIATIFNQLTAQKQNANQFLETFFQDGNLSPMQNFLDRVVKTFRDLVCKNFDVNPSITAQEILKHELQLRAEQQERALAEQRAIEAEALRLKQQAALAQEAAKAAAAQQETDTEAQHTNDLPHLQDVLDEVQKIANQIVATLKFERKHTDVVNDLEFLANSILDAAEKRELMLVNGLVIGTEYAAKKTRSIRHLVEDLHNLIYNYYDYLEDEAKNPQNADAPNAQGIAEDLKLSANPNEKFDAIEGNENFEDGVDMFDEDDDEDDGNDE